MNIKLIRDLQYLCSFLTLHDVQVLNSLCYLQNQLNVPVTEIQHDKWKPKIEGMIWHLLVLMNASLKGTFRRDGNDGSCLCHLSFYKYVRKPFLRPLLREFRFSSDIERIFLLEYRRFESFVASDIDILV